MDNVDDMVESLYRGDESAIDELAHKATILGKKPESIVPVINAMRKNPEIWSYDFETGQTTKDAQQPGELDAMQPTQDPAQAPGALDAESQAQLENATSKLDVTSQALGAYLSGVNQQGTKEQMQYASNYPVGNASLAGVLTGDLYKQGGGMPPGMSPRLKGA